MKKEKKKGGNKLNLIICGIAFIVMLVYLFVFDKPDAVLNALRSLNPLFFGLCIAFMVGYWLCESATVHSILKGIHPEAKFRNTLTNTIIGQYFNCITPSASGGQPMQAYYFVKMGVPLSAGLTALFSRFIVYQFVLTIYSVVTLCIGFGQFGAELSGKGLMPFVFIGFGVNTIVIIFLLGIALWKSGTTKVINGLISLLAKMKIMKHPMKYRVIVSREIKKFNNNFKFLKKNVPIIIKSVFYTTLQLTLYLSISYVLYKGFGLEGTSLLKVISYQAFVLMISSFVPLPGAMGAAEIGYTGFFNDIFGSYIGVSTMLWRILTFYLPIIVGMVFILTLKKRGIGQPTAEDVKNNVLVEDELDAENDN